MPCRFAAQPCSAVNLVCFRCVDCKRRFSIEKAALDQMATAVAQLPECAAPPGDPTGVGARLKKLLSRLGVEVEVTADCRCNDRVQIMNDRVQIMNDRGIEWCEQNSAEIVGWLKEEADQRKLPFLTLPTKILVQRAIKMAKRARDKRAPQ